MSHRIPNWIFMKISGRRLRAYSIVKHVGRVSGREYRTPVSAYPLRDGFVIPVLYGTDSQWVRNAVANDGFTLRTVGEDVPLEHPEFVPAAEALPAYPRLLRRLMTAQGIEHFLLAHRPRPAVGSSSAGRPGTI